MNKQILALGLFLVLFALVECSGKCRRQCKPKDSSRVICATDKSGRQCRRMKECRLKEENCRLRSLKRPILIQTNSKHCRNIKSSSGIGKCARRSMKGSKSVRRCTHMPCKDDGKTCCNRSRDGKCQILTRCQRIIANCRRGVKNQLTKTNNSACRGMKLGQDARRCRTSKH